MVVIIKKRHAGPAEEPAPLVEGATTAQPAEAPVETPHTPQQSIDWWTKHGLSPDAKPVKCAHCGQFYLKPCNKSESERCENFKWFSQNKSLSAGSSK